MQKKKYTSIIKGKKMLQYFKYYLLVQYAYKILLIPI